MSPSGGGQPSRRGEVEEGRKVRRMESGKRGAVEKLGAIVLDTTWRDRRVVRSVPRLPPEQTSSKRADGKPCAPMYPSSRTTCWQPRHVCRCCTSSWNILGIWENLPLKMAGDLRAYSDYALK